MEMTGGFYGADVAELRKLAGMFSKQADSLAAAVATVTNGVQSSVWLGPIAVQFRVTWTQKHSVSLQAAIDLLRTLAKTLLDQTKQQEDASTGGSSPLVPVEPDPAVVLGSVAQTLQVLLDQQRRAEAVTDWYAENKGQVVDVNGNPGPDCPDVPESYAQYLFGVGYQQTLGGGNANQLWGNANPDYFTQIPPTEKPQVGDIICWSENRVPGRPDLWQYGHVAVVVSVDPDGTPHFVEESTGSDAGVSVTPDSGNSPYFQSVRPYLQGYLRPNVDKFQSSVGQ